MFWCKTQTKPHPRDGCWSWMVCGVTLVLNLILFGMLLGFGVLLPVLSEVFEESKGKTAWVGSLATGLSFAVGPLVVKLTSRFTIRTLSIFGSITCMTSLVLSSFAPDMTTLFFSYGLLFGLGGGFIITTMTMALNAYFKTKLAKAMGISTMGGSLGVLVVGPTMQVLLDTFGWRTALRIMSGAMLLMSVLSITYDTNVEREKKEINQEKEDGRQERETIRQAESRFHCAVWRNCAYTVGTISVFIVFFGLYAPMFHLVRFAKDVNISSSQASQLFIYVGACSGTARFLTGLVLSRHWITPLRCVQLAAFTIGTAVVVFTQAARYSHFIAFSVCYGLGNGCFISSQAVFFLTVVEPRQAPMAISYGFVFASVAIFAGPAAAGFIADQMGSYIPSFFIIGGLVIVAGLLPLTVTCWRTAPKTTQDTPNGELKSRMELVGLRLANDL